VLTLEIYAFMLEKINFRNRLIRRVVMHHLKKLLLVYSISLLVCNSLCYCSNTDSLSKLFLTTAKTSADVKKLPEGWQSLDTDILEQGLIKAFLIKKKFIQNTIPFADSILRHLISQSDTSLTHRHCSKNSDYNDNRCLLQKLLSWGYICDNYVLACWLIARGFDSQIPCLTKLYARHTFGHIQVDDENDGINRKKTTAAFLSQYSDKTIALYCKHYSSHHKHEKKHAAEFKKNMHTLINDLRATIATM
jgi:hypothetical protein